MAARSLCPGVDEVNPAQIKEIDNEALAALLEHALDPRVPVEVLYAVLECLCRPSPCRITPAELEPGTIALGPGYQPLHAPTGTYHAAEYLLK